jgi:carotenoid cleavage dioxygenase-like enzyme
VSAQLLFLYIYTQHVDKQVVSSSLQRAYVNNTHVHNNSTLHCMYLAGKPLHSTAALSWPAGWAAAFIERRRSTANRGVVCWGRLCVAMWEGGLPWKIDAKNLETYFQDDFKGYLRKGVSFELVVVAISASA